jgi:hypothetical protein
MLLVITHIHYAFSDSPGLLKARKAARKPERLHCVQAPNFAEVVSHALLVDKTYAAIVTPTVALDAKKELQKQGLLFGLRIWTEVTRFKQALLGRYMKAAPACS